MTKFALTLSALFIGISLTGCTNKEAIKKTIEDNPELVFSAIEKNPEKFIEVVNKAAREAQMKQQAGQAAEEEKQRAEEFKNPAKPVVAEDRAILGPKDAPITIVEYSDFECHYCSRAYGTVKEVMDAYEGKVRVVYKHLPLDFHAKAMPAAQMFEAIALQSPEKAYAWHDKVFENQGQFKEGGVDWMKAQAKELGVDMAKLEKDMQSEEVKKRIEADMAEAKKYGFSGTPGFLINGVSLKGAYPASEFKVIIDKHLEAVN